MGAGRREPVSVYGGGALPDALIAPGDAGYFDVYWPRLQTPIVEAGQAITFRGSHWLVESAMVWHGRPGGTHGKVRLCDAEGMLFRRTSTATPYGVTHAATGFGIPFIGVLGVALSDEDGGHLTTTADLTPAGNWTGTSGDRIVLTDGSTWEQVGDITERTTAGGTWAGRKSRLNVVHVRRVRDGSTVSE